MIKRFSLLIGMLAAGLLTVRAFSPAGPVGNAGDAWQHASIGYGPPRDLVAPKNIGEEYRRNVPVYYYGYNANFLDFFGSNGVSAVDSAYDILNKTFTNNLTGIATGLDGYSADLSEFPLDSRQYKYQAQALGLTDLKSTALSFMVEQMGLATPEMYVWTLHDNLHVGNVACPSGEEYFVVQRNLDVVNSPLNQLQYSSYINNTLYTYFIQENCTGPNPLRYTVPFPTDPLANDFTTVASFSLFGIEDGGFYSGLTRDDVGGLRYLLTTNNINIENAGLGSLLQITNPLPPSVLTTLPISLLLSQAITNDPSTLQTNYPGLTILSTATNIVTQITPTVSLFYTNLPPPYTNRVPLSNGIAIYQTNGIVPFTNWSPVQYGDPPILLTTQPLLPLLYYSQFIDPVTLAGLYPGLLLGGVKTNYIAIDIQTNMAPYFTNQTVLPVFSNSVTGGLPLVTTLTNIYYFTNQPGPTTINYDRTVPFTTISTLDLATFVDLARTNDPATLSSIYTNLQILRALSSPAFIPVTNYISYLTNATGAPYQGPPKLVTVPVSTNYQWVTNWTYTFGNVFTNHFYTNRYITVQSIWVTNQIGAPYGSPFKSYTNFVTYKTNQISGDFFLIPTNWCGFDLTLAFPLGNPPYKYGTTNTIIYAGYNTNGAVGTNGVGGTTNTYSLTQFVYDQYTNYNYAVYPGICEPVVVWGTNYSTNAIYKYQYDFLNVVTNHYYTNSLVSLFITNIYYIPGGSPDLLATNITVTSYYTNLPGGDFYLVPQTWCGYQILALLTNYITPTNIVLTNTTYGTGTITNAQYTYVDYFSYTNYTYSIRPGFCEPALQSTTNYSTNIVTLYSYNFGNIVTNSFYTNSPIIITTTNLALLDGGLVGQLTTNISTVVSNTGISGDFFIVPDSWCSYKILSNLLTTVVFTTNTVVATNTASATNVGQTFVQTTITSNTNHTFLIQISTCQGVTAPARLRQGIEKIQFIRADYDSLLGQFFQPVTNNYTMKAITNSQLVVEYYQRIATQPDFLLSAEDLTDAPDNATLIQGGVSRNLNFDQSTILPGLAGPGLINSPTTISFNKVGDLFYNAYLNTNTLIGEIDQVKLLAWGSFDSSTNDAVVYPNGTSIQNTVNQVLIQITPQVLPAGTVGTAYPATSFTATGGAFSAPFTWSVLFNSGSLPAGLTLSPSGTISGTPTQSGTFDFVLQLTDSLSRTVQWNYSITIQ